MSDIQIHENPNQAIYDKLHQILLESLRVNTLLLEISNKLERLVAIAENERGLRG